MMKPNQRTALLLVVMLALYGCSTFESFRLGMSQEIAYGDTAVPADGAAELAEIAADRELMKQAAEPHTVEVKLPPEMMPAIAVTEAPPDLAPGASGLATMSDGTTLFDCVDGKGETVVCRREPAL